MSNFEHTNGNPDLPLSQEAIAAARNELAEALIRRGSIEPNPGIDKIEGELSPRNFNYPLTKELAQKILGDGVIASRAVAECSTPVDLDPEAHDGKYGFGINVTAYGILPDEAINTVNEVHIKANIGIRERHDGRFEAFHDTEYSRGDMRISPNGLEYGEVSNLSPEEIEELLDDTIERDLMREDGDLLHEVAEYVMQHPKID